MRFALGLTYDGLRFRGFALNPDVATVAGVLQDALAKIYGQPVMVTCAGRTDAGVHARGQVITFDVPEPDNPARALLPAKLQRSLNAMCGDDGVVVDTANIVTDDFDARGSALARSYRYTVLAQPWPDPIRRGQVWHVRHPLDLEAMRDSAQVFIGAHDFTSFCRRKEVTVDGETIIASNIRRVRSTEWVTVTSEPADDDGRVWGELRFDITANAFCTQMVRSIVAALVEVGLGRNDRMGIEELLAARDRQLASAVAPPQGLVLWHVEY